MLHKSYQGGWTLPSVGSGAYHTNLSRPAILDDQFKSVITAFLPNKVVDDCPFGAKPVPGLVFGTVTTAVEKTSGFRRSIGGNQGDPGSNKTVTEVILALVKTSLLTHRHRSSGKGDCFEFAENLSTFLCLFEKLQSARYAQ